MFIWNGNTRKVIVPRDEVNAFRQAFQPSTISGGLRGCSLQDRSYWFEFDDNGDLIDTDVPEHSGGKAVPAVANPRWRNDGAHGDAHD